MDKSNLVFEHKYSFINVFNGGADRKLVIALYVLYWCIAVPSLLWGSYVYFSLWYLSGDIDTLILAIMSLLAPLFVYLLFTLKYIKLKFYKEGMSNVLKEFNWSEFDGFKIKDNVIVCIVNNKRGPMIALNDKKDEIINLFNSHGIHEKKTE